MESNNTVVKEYIEQEDWEAVLPLLHEQLKLELNEEILKLRAITFQKLGRFSDSINDYNSLLKINPGNSEYQSAKIMLEQILSMSRLDVFECTNTHLDPWD